MSTLDTNANKKTFLRYVFVSILCLVFGIVYELFSNEVYSAFMIGAFVVPLVLGAVPFLMFGLIKTQKSPSIYSRYLYHSGIATLTVGSIIQGVFEISGTSNNLVIIYLYVGLSLLGAGIVAYIVDLILKTSK